MSSESGGRCFRAAASASNAQAAAQERVPPEATAALGNALQHRLETRYDLDLGHQVSDFIFSDPEIAANLRGPGGRSACEQVLVCEEAGTLSISVFLDAGVLARLQRRDPLVAVDDDALDALGLIIEGVSHFVCLVWHAQHGRSCTQLELELQAEIDKFTLMHDLLREQRGRVPADLRQRLFERVSFPADLPVEEHHRYRDANTWAARFCATLQHRFSDRLDHPDAKSLLRRFFRWAQPQKFAWMQR